MSVLEWIEAWLQARRPDADIALTAETDLYKTGLLDSLGIIELVEAIEDQYGILFTDEEMQAGLTSVSAFEQAVSSRS